MWRLGVAAAAAVGVTVLAYAVLCLFPLIGARLAERARATGDVELLERAVTTETTISVVALAVLAVAGVLVIWWLFRARRNLDAFPGARPAMGPAWAIGGWFVPFANLALPYLVMVDVARYSLPARRTRPLVVLWWLPFLAWNVIGRLTSSIDSDDYYALQMESVDFPGYVAYWNDALVRNLFDLVPMAVAGVALIVLILWISRAQQQRVGAGGPTGPGTPDTAAAPPAPERPMEIPPGASMVRP